MTYFFDVYIAHDDVYIRHDAIHIHTQCMYSIYKYSYDIYICLIRMTYLYNDVYIHKKSSLYLP